MDPLKTTKNLGFVMNAIIIHKGRVVMGATEKSSNATKAVMTKFPPSSAAYSSSPTTTTTTTTNYLLPPDFLNLVSLLSSLAPPPPRPPPPSGLLGVVGCRSPVKKTALMPITRG